MNQHNHHQSSMAHPNRSPSEFKPLAPSMVSYPHFASPEVDRDPEPLSDTQISRLKKCVLLCGCITALIVIFVVILIVLAFTVYNVKDLNVKMNNVTLLKGNLSTESLTLLTDVSVKNTNYFEYKYGSTTTTYYYAGVPVAEGTTPAGKAKARRTMRFNVTLEVVTKRLVETPNWEIDIKDHVFNISSYTRIDGKVKVLGMFKRKVVVEMNCTSQYNLDTGLITHGNDCLGNVDI